MKISGTIDLGMIIAAYGAVLSSILAIKSWLNSKPRVKVKVKTVLIPNQNGEIEDYMAVDISNHGSVTIHLSGWGFILPNNKQLVFPRTAFMKESLPCDLPPGRSNYFAVRREELYMAFQDNEFSLNAEIRGFVRDDLSREYRTKKFNLN